MPIKEWQFQPGNKPGGEKTRWQRGQSGNPAGVPRSRREFEQAFNAALVEHLPPDEAAGLLAKAARAGEGWAVMEVCKRYSPQTTNLKLEVENANSEFDFNRLTAEQLRQFIELAEAAKPLTIEGRGVPS